MEQTACVASEGDTPYLRSGMGVCETGRLKTGFQTASVRFRLPFVQQMRDTPDDGGRRLVFAAFGQGGFAVFVDQGDLVVVAAHGQGHVVGGDEGDVFFQAFGAGVFQHVAAFGGEADAEGRVRQGGGGGEDVGVFGQFDTGGVPLPSFLILCAAAFFTV